MIDNPLPNQIMEQKDAEAQEQAYKEHCFSEAKEFCDDNSVHKDLIEEFQTWYYNYCGNDEIEKDELKWFQPRDLIDDWWDENGDDYDDYDSPYDIDPTPQYLYDDTGGEPPISAEERRDAEFRKKYGWA
jgi:hypothetical protein